MTEDLAARLQSAQRKIAQLKEDNQLLRRKIENHIIMSEDFKAEYNSWLDSINECYADGEPCSHPGCLHHVSHPCEICGRTAGVNAINVEVK